MKEDKKIVSLNLPTKMVVKLKERASEEGRSLSNFVSMILEKEVEKEKAA